MFETTTTLEFITGSRYYGSYNKSLKQMDGYGQYTYPDGSTYRGLFKNGLFHGFGKLSMGDPHNFQCQGLFLAGRLHRIVTLRFNDGLHVSMPFHGGQLDMTLWEYCRNPDRRFVGERLFGIEPVGPTSRTTKSYDSRSLPVGCYDVEEGIYKPASNLVAGIPKPFYPVRFVACDDEEQWIQENCRVGHTASQPLPLKQQVCEQILDNNFRSSHAVGRCICCDAERKCHLYKELTSEKGVEEEREETEKSIVFSKSLASSLGSLDIESLRENVLENFACQINSDVVPERVRDEKKSVDFTMKR